MRGFKAGRSSGLGLAAVMIASASASPARAAGPFSTGQAVQVREGDVWSAATVTGHEGRRYHVHYDATSSADDEWVTDDRIRSPVGGTPTPPVAPRPATPAAAPKATPTFSPHDHVQVKWGGLYRAATVVNARNGWYLIQYDGSRSDLGREWVESDRVRTVGSTDDPIGYASPHGYRRGDDPPAGPSKVGAGPGAGGADGRTKADPAAAVNVVDADVDGAQVLTPAVPDGPVVPTPPPDVPTAAAPKQWPLGHGPLKWGRTSLVVNPQGKDAVLVYTPFGGQDQVVNVQRVHTGTGTTSKVQPLGADLDVLTVNPDASRLVTTGGRFGHDARADLTVWDLTGDVPNAMMSFRPGGTGGGGGVAWARYADGTHLLTCSDRHEVDLWDLSTAGAVRCVYTLAGQPGIPPTVTGGGRYFAAGFDDHLVVCDALTGRCVAGGKPPPVALLPVAVRPDLKRAVATGRHRLVMTNLEHGGTVDDVNLPQSVMGDSAAWVGDHLLLLDARWLYDTDRRAVLWDYTTAGEAARAVGGRVWTVTTTAATAPGGAGQMALASLPVPDADALAADRSLAPAPVLVGPSSTVALRVDVQATDAQKQEIIDTLTQRLAATGATVAADAPVTLVAAMRNGNTQSGRYTPGPFGGPAGTDVSVTQTVYSLSFEDQGKPVWSADNVTGYLPYVVRMRPGQSVGDAVAEMNKPRPDWFLTVQFPGTIVAATDPVGATTLGGTGHARPGRLRPR